MNNSKEIEKTKHVVEMIIEKVDYFMAKAEAASFSSRLTKETMRELSGALLIDPNSGDIVVTAYSGFVDGFEPKKINKNKLDIYDRGVSREHIVRAEINVLIKCALYGINPRNKILVATRGPNKEMARVLQNAGIMTVIFNKWDKSPELLKDYDISFDYEEHKNCIVLTFRPQGQEN